MRVLVSVAFLLVACKHTPEKPPAVTLTADLVGRAREIQIYTNDGKAETFPAALAKAKAMLGEPTHVDGAKHQWAVIDGDTCVYYTLEDKAGNAASPGTATVYKTDPECLAATGAK